MGILNATPDSFSDGGQLYHNGQLNLSAALYKAQRLQDEGAAIIDVGGESTRPGATPVSLQEELDRVIPLIEALASRLGALLSVDTSQPAVITAAAAAGAHLINDVRALRLPNALSAAAHTGLPVCLMHMQGDPLTMQHNPHYQQLLPDIHHFFAQRLAACQAAGIPHSHLLLDPGIGFGKNDQHNLQLLQHLPQLAGLGCPLLVGLSRKSFIGRLLGRELPERLAGSLGFGLIALQRGAHILRVHDVAATADIIRIHQLTHPLPPQETP